MGTLQKVYSEAVVEFYGKAAVLKGLMYLRGKAIARIDAPTLEYTRRRGLRRRQCTDSCRI